MGDVTIEHVAALAQVSRGTVSNVLNRPHIVAPATRERVELAVRELGFVPDLHARLLAGGRNRSIAIIIHDIGNPFFAEAARGAEDVAAEHDYLISITSTRADDRRQEATLRMSLAQQISGALLSPTKRHDTAVETLRERGIPVVLLDHAGGPAECSVAVDDTGGGMVAAEHLLQQGIRQFVFVGGPHRVRQHQERLQGIRKAVRAAEGRHAIDVVQVAQDNVHCGVGAAEAILVKHKTRRRERTGVLCGNDLLAFGVMRVLVEHGVRIPEEVALVGYDDIDFARSLLIPLTSVRQPAYELGRSAARLLISEIEADPGEHRHQSGRFTPELIIRSSSSAL